MAKAYPKNAIYCRDCAYLTDDEDVRYCDEANKHIELVEKCPEGMFDNSIEEKEFIVPVTWEMCGFIKVKAQTSYNAFIKVKNDVEDYPLPEKGSYIDGSFGPSFDTEEMIEEYTKMYEKGELKL